MVLVVHIEGVGEVLRLAGRRKHSTVKRITPVGYSTDSSKSVLPVNVGPQGHGLSLHLLHRTGQNTRVLT